MVSILLSAVGLKGQIWKKAMEESAKELVDVKGFIRTVAGYIKRNSILLAFADEYMELNVTLRAASGPTDLEELRLAVVRAPSQGLCYTRRRARFS